MVILSNSHPTMALKSNIKIITEHFFKQHGFNYFQYLRCYEDGSIGLLTNDTAVLEYAVNLKKMPYVYSSFTQEHEQLHSYWFLWEEELPAFPVQLANQLSNLNHGITLVRRCKKHYDMIAFALAERKNNIASFYLTKQKAMQEFIDAFDKSQTGLIEVMQKNPIVLSKPRQDINCEKICLLDRKIQIASPNGMIHITSQELACLRLLMQGATYKQIAQILHLSSRTVETYLLRLKTRSGMHSRLQLKKLLSVCPG